MVTEATGNRTVILGVEAPCVIALKSFYKRFATQITAKFWI